MRQLLWVVGVLAVTITSAAAHHSYGAYLRDQTTMIEGKLDRFLYANPHAMLTVTTMEGQTYTAEWANLKALGQAGVTKATLKPGDHIVVAGSPNRDPAMRQLSLLTEVRRPSDGWEWKREARGR